MHVRKHFQIAPHENGMARHPHVQLEILHRLAMLIVGAERKRGQALRHERRVVANPGDLAWSWRRRIGGPRAVIAGQRRALDVLGLDLSRHRFRDAGGVHEIGEQLVLARGHGRQALLEHSESRFARMQVPQADRVTATARTSASGGHDRERSRRGAGCRSIPDRSASTRGSSPDHSRRRDQRLVDVAIVGGRFDGPPHVAEDTRCQSRPRSRSRRQCGRAASRADRASRPRRASLPAPSPTRCRRVRRRAAA